MLNLEKLKYPIGKFSESAYSTENNIDGWIKDLRDFPMLLNLAVAELGDTELNQNYRPGGWSVRQVVHHLADSHTIGLLRFKWALSEKNCVIKTYPEDVWATFADYKLPIDSPLKMITAVHAQWLALLESFTESDWKRTYTNPESGTIQSLEKAVAIYAHHGLHHLAQINLLKK